MGETEEERLRNDALTRERMNKHMKAVEEAEARGETGDRAAWKWAIRKRIWDYMENNGIAANPRPVHNRIPNFVNAELTAEQVKALPEFQEAKFVKVNPDTPQKSVRVAIFRAGKLLMVPQPRLRTGFFSKLNPELIDPGRYNFAGTQPGVRDLGEPIDLDAKLKVDMVFMGSVAVNPSNGARIGKGEGFAELEYGMLRYMGAIDDDTPVVTCCHDCQIVNDIPTEKMLVHDVPVDIICTPTRTIRVPRVLPKPTGIYWDKLSPQKLASIRILQVLKAKLERELGYKLPSGPDEVLPPTAIRGGKGNKGNKGEKGNKGQKGDGKGDANLSKGGKASAQNRWQARSGKANKDEGYPADTSSGKGGSSGGRRWRPKDPQ